MVLLVLRYLPTNIESEEDLGNKALFRTGAITGGSRDDRSGGLSRGFPLALAVVAPVAVAAPPEYKIGEINVLLLGEDNGGC